MKKANIGMIGLAVMGENLSKNMESKGYIVSVFDIDKKRVEEFSEENKTKNFISNMNLKDFVASLESPKKIMLMIKAGNPVDQVIEQLIPFLSKGDIIIDGGNSNFKDTNRRVKYLKDKDIHFIGSGVSGGEFGALTGPSIMPGGSIEAWPHVEPIFKAIAADVNGDKCSEWMGEDGAGHFVKMVHNGIEYADMQLIAEIYHLLKDVLNLEHDEMAHIFSKWNRDKLDSYLIEITADILAFKDKDNNPLVTKILDKAGQKGTGKWTAITSLEENIPLSLISEAVYARLVSSQKQERVVASELYKQDNTLFKGKKEEFIDHLENSLFVAKVISYAQGFSLMKKFADNYNWNLNYYNIAKIWRGGCIIRSRFLNNIMEAFETNPNLNSLLLDPYFVKVINSSIDSLKIVLKEAINHNIATPTLSAAFNYFNSYNKEILPTNLIQAQRDYFGAHTYERIDKEEGEFFHTNWTGLGGKTSSTTYND